MISLVMGLRANPNDSIDQLHVQVLTDKVGELIELSARIRLRRWCGQRHRLPCGQIRQQSASEYGIVEQSVYVGPQG